MTWTVPNILTVFRLLAAPMVALVYVLVPEGAAHWLAFGLFIGAAVTDWLDGYLARAWGQESRFGAMLDPIADKAMVVIALSVLLVQRDVTGFLLVPVVVILFREVFVSGLREFLGDTAGLLKVTQLAKWKTTVQMVAIAVLLAASGAGSPVMETVGIGLLWVGAVLTAITGADYFRKALPYLRSE